MNDGVLLPNYYALGEQRSGDFGPDVLTLDIEDGRQWTPGNDPGDNDGGVVTLADAPPKTRFHAECERDAAFYLARRRTLTVRHVSDDRVVAMIEIVSAGNKRNYVTLAAFMEKVMTAFREGVHLMVVDLFPPRSCDPVGMHGVIWDYIEGEDGDQYVPPAGEPLTLVSYIAASPVKAFVEPIAVGRVLPDMPLFLTKEHYVNVPLEDTYMAAYRGVPRRFKQVLEAEP